MNTWNFQNGNGYFPSKNQLEGIGVKRVGQIDSRLYFIDCRQILYAFKGSASKRGIVNIPKFHPAVFSPNRIYIRTSKSVFLTSHRSFEALRQTLDSVSFERSHQKFLVNLRKVGWLETRNKTNHLAIIHDDGIPEQIPVTRQYKPKILEAFHVPQSRQLKKNKSNPDPRRKS